MRQVLHWFSISDSCLVEGGLEQVATHPICHVLRCFVQDVLLLVVAILTRVDDRSREWSRSIYRFLRLLDPSSWQRLSHVLGFDLLSAIILVLELDLAWRYLHAVFGTDRLVSSPAWIFWWYGHICLAKRLLCLLSKELMNFYLSMIHRLLRLVAIEQKICDVELFKLRLAVGDPGHAVVIIHLRLVYQLLVVRYVQEEVWTFFLWWHDLMSLRLH